jgi:hypothetical protein
MVETNKHGLKRDIPSHKKLQVRKNCGFGCVICGNAICHYDHVDPEFNDATDHEPDKIALLCGSCHDKKSRKRISVDTVKKALANPKCLQQGFSSDWFDISGEDLEVILASTIYKNVHEILKIEDEAILRIDPPEDSGAPVRLSAVFYDKFGKLIAEIKENEWIAYSDNWDVEVEGQETIIRQKMYDISLKLRISPPNKIEIKTLKMFYKGCRISCNNELLIITNKNNETIAFYNILVDGLGGGIFI